MEINLGNTVPLFAHDVAISTLTKENEEDGKLKKEIFTELVFIDSVRKTAIARIMLPENVFKGLPKIIEDNLKKVKKERKNKESIFKKKEEKGDRKEEKDSPHSYFR